MQRYYYYLAATIAALLLVLGGGAPEEGPPGFAECLNGSRYPNSSLPAEVWEADQMGAAPSLNRYALCALEQLHSIQSPASYTSAEEDAEGGWWDCSSENASEICEILGSLSFPEAP
jgi:hypothetical protein